MSPLLAHGAHLVGLVAGLMLLLRARNPDGKQTAQVFPVLALTLTAAMGIGLFIVSDPSGLFEDFRDAYLRAGTAVRESPAALAPMLERGVNGFVNLPILAYLFWPFALMPAKVAMVVFSLLGLACTVGAWHALVRGLRLERATALALLFAFAASGPLVNSVKEGNITHFLLWPLVVAMLLVRRGDDFRAGIVLGSIALLKLPFLLFGVYYLLRGRWHIALGGLLVCALASLASLAVFGWDMHVLWYEQCIRPFAQHPMPAFNVQSIQAFVLRLQVGAPGLLVWDVMPLSAWGKALSTALVLLTYGAVAWVLWRTRRESDLRSGTASAESSLLHPSDAQFMLVMLLACVTSPLNWSHYFCWLLLPAACFLKSEQQDKPGRLAARACGWFALVAGSMAVITIAWGGSSMAELHARSATSLLLVAGLAWMVWLGRNLRPLASVARSRAPEERQGLTTSPG